MDISVIISTWNNADRLKLTIDSFLKCLIPQGVSWECIVVDNNSTDATKEVILSFGEKLPIKYVFEPLQGISNARNAGLRLAQGKLIIFTDDDVEPCSEWLYAYWKAFQENPSGYYWGGPIESTYEQGSLAPELAKIAPASVKGFDLGNKESIVSSDQYFLGANWGAPAFILKSLNGFDPNRGLNPNSERIKVSEETDLMGRLNEQEWKGCYLPQASIRHFVPLKKMSITHIAQRWEAWGYEVSIHYSEHLKNPSVLGVPSSLLKEGFMKWKDYVFKRITGKNWYQSYAVYIEFIGILKGLKEIQKTKCSLTELKPQQRSF